MKKISIICTLLLLFASGQARADIQYYLKLTEVVEGSLKVESCYSNKEDYCEFVSDIPSEGYYGKTRMFLGPLRALAVDGLLLYVAIGGGGFYAVIGVGGVVSFAHVSELANPSFQVKKGLLLDRINRLGSGENRIYYQSYQDLMYAKRIILSL